MKKLLAIIVLSLLWSGNTHSQVVELDKCINIKGLWNNSDIKTWDEKTYNEKNTIYYKFFDQPKLVNNSLKATEFFRESALNKAKRKELIKDGFKKIKWSEKNTLSIDLNNGTITTLFSFTDEAWKYKQESKTRFNSGIKKYNLQNKQWVKDYKKFELSQREEKTKIEKFIITDYVSRIAIGYKSDQERIYPKQRFSIKVDLDKMQYHQGFANRIQNNPLVSFLCSNPNLRANSSIGKSYLDYWWAVILIIAITFFIFTQSGKRLKQIRRK